MFPYGIFRGHALGQRRYPQREGEIIARVFIAEEITANLSSRAEVMANEPEKEPAAPSNGDVESAISKKQEMPHC